MRTTIKFLFFLGLALIHLSCSTAPKSSPSEMETALKNFSDGNFSLAKPTFENQCTNGERAACTHLGQILDGLGQHEQARANYEKACKDGDKYGCFLLGESYYKIGHLVEAKPLFEKTQDTVYLSGQYLAIIDLAQNNLSDAQKILDSQCRNHFVTACAIAGINYEANGQFKTAKNYYKMACALNFGVGCAHLSTLEIFIGNRNEGEELAGQDCANGGTRSCRIVKLLYQIKNDPELPGHWMLDCKKNDDKSCYVFGLLQILQPKTLTEGKKALQKACKLGDGYGCLEIANFLSPFKDHEKYARLMTEGCEKGAGPACAVLQSGTFPYDVKAAPNSFLEKGCILGDGAACVQSAHFAWRANQKDKALFNYEAACKLDSPEGCYWKVRFNSENEGEKLNSFKDLCTRKFGAACGSVADSLKSSGDFLGASTFYKLACKLHDQRSCYLLISLQADGKTTSMEKMCDQGYELACYDAGKLFEASGDIAKAKATFRRGCDLMSGDSCAYLGFLALNEKKNIEAQSMFREACDYGSAYGCNRIEIQTTSIQKR